MADQATLGQPTIDLNKGGAMNRHRTRILTAIAAVGALAAAALLFLPAQATPPDKVTTTIIGIGRFTKIDAKVKTDINPGSPTEFWKARIKTKGSSDLHVLQNTIAPGGTFGWHSHPGPSLVIVKSGTATFYLAAHPTCTPHVVPAGSGFVDQGHDVHVVRNEGSVDLVTVVVSLVPADAVRRIDEPSPGNCLPNG
jgi:quercetin dioxygenase-like cupin family protein